MGPRQLVERRFIPDRHRRSVVIFRACQDLGLLIQFKHRDSSSSKRLEGRLKLAATEISTRKRPVADRLHDHGGTRFVCVLIQHHEFGQGGSPDPMMFPYLIPASPRYSESYVRVIALGRKQHAEGFSIQRCPSGAKLFRNCDSIHLRFFLFSPHGARLHRLSMQKAMIVASRRRT
jgi:hypothetical protein